MKTFNYSCNFRSGPLKGSICSDHSFSELAMLFSKYELYRKQIIQFVSDGAPAIIFESKGVVAATLNKKG
jgi:hypothetical protein